MPSPLGGRLRLFDFVILQGVARALLDGEGVEDLARVVDEVRREGGQVVAEGVQGEAGHLLVPHGLVAVRGRTARL